MSTDDKITSYCTDRSCRQTGARHLHEPFKPRPSDAQRIAELERIVDIDQ